MTDDFTRRFTDRVSDQVKCRPRFDATQRESRADFACETRVYAGRPAHYPPNS